MKAAFYFDRALALLSPLADWDKELDYRETHFEYGHHT